MEDILEKLTQLHSNSLLHASDGTLKTIFPGLLTVQILHFIYIKPSQSTSI